MASKMAATTSPWSKKAASLIKERLEMQWGWQEKSVQ